MAGRLLHMPARNQHANRSGKYKIEGQTLLSGVGYRTRVLLFPLNSIVPIRDVWSSVDGDYSFTGLALDTYIVLAIDKTAARNAVAYSHVTPVAM